MLCVCVIVVFVYHLVISFSLLLCNSTFSKFTCIFMFFCVYIVAFKLGHSNYYNFLCVFCFILSLVSHLFSLSPLSGKSRSHFSLSFFLSECVVCFPIKRNGTHSIQAHIFDYFLRFSILIKHVRWGRRKGGRTLAMRIYNAKWEGGLQ